MINQNQKLYYICEDCSKQETCKYYNDVIQTIDNFIKTPLNIHFPMCSEYQSMLNKLWNDIENNTPIAELNELSNKQIEESLEQSLVQMKLMREGKLPKKSLKNMFKNIKEENSKQ